MKAYWTQLAAILVVLSLPAGCLSVAPAGTPTPPAPAATPTAPPAAVPTRIASALEQALAGKYKGTTVSVGGQWDSSYYLATLTDFHNKTGITFSYEQVNADSPAWRAQVADGKGPDVVQFGYLSQLKGFARQGKVVDLSQFLDMETLRSRYDQDWLDWATMDGPGASMMGGLWGFAFIDSLVYYPKAAFDAAGYQVPTTWDELLALSDRIVKDGGTPWCIENSDGFTAVHWIGDTMLRTVATADYYAWIKGKLPFDSPQVKNAVQLMADIWFKPGYAYGLRKDLNTTSRVQADSLMLETPPKCWLLKEPSWIMVNDTGSGDSRFNSKEYGKDYAFFVLPAIDKAHGAPVQAEPQIVGMFRDRPEVRALMEYISTGAQFENWLKQPGPAHHGSLSPYKATNLDSYTKPEDRAVAELAVAAQKAGNLQVVGGDTMLPEVTAQFYKSMTSYVNGDIDLDTALKQIDAAGSAPTATATATP